MLKSKSEKELREFELSKSHNDLVNSALSELCEVLAEVEMLDEIIKENQIRRFKAIWKEILNDKSSDYKAKLEDKTFKSECKYLFGRMDETNKIKERIINLTQEAKEKLTQLK